MNQIKTVISSDGLFPSLEKPSPKQTLIDTEYGKVELQFQGQFPFFHAEIRKWSKSLYKEYLEVWDEVLLELHERGFNEIFCMIPTGDEKLYKFECMFGFLPLFTVIDKEGKTYYIMSQEI